MLKVGAWKFLVDTRGGAIGPWLPRPLPPSVLLGLAVGSVRVQPPEASAIRLAARCLRSSRGHMAEARSRGLALRLPKPGTWTPRMPWGVKGTRGDPPRWKPGEQSWADPGGRSGLGAALGREPRRCRPGVSAELLVPSSSVPVPFSSISPTSVGPYPTPGWQCPRSRCSTPARLLSSHSSPLLFCPHPTCKKNAILLMKTP